MNEKLRAVLEYVKEGLQAPADLLPDTPPRRENDGVAETSVTTAPEVLDGFRGDVGRFRGQTGGVLLCTGQPGYIDGALFDDSTRGAPGPLNWGSPSMTALMETPAVAGLYRSCPAERFYPIYEDLCAALACMAEKGLDSFWLILVLPDLRGQYTMDVYALERGAAQLSTRLCYELKAGRTGYELVPFTARKKNYALSVLENYRRAVQGWNEQKNSR